MGLVQVYFLGLSEIVWKMSGSRSVDVLWDHMGIKSGTR